MPPEAVVDPERAALQPPCAGSVCTRRDWRDAVHYTAPMTSQCPASAAAGAAGAVQLTLSDTDTGSAARVRPPLRRQPPRLLSPARRRTDGDCRGQLGDFCLTDIGWKRTDIKTPHYARRSRPAKTLRLPESCYVGVELRLDAPTGQIHNLLVREVRIAA